MVKLEYLHHFSYSVRRSGFDARTDRYGLFVNFDADVKLTISHLNVKFLTLLTRIGGIIGVGKEFLWLTVSFLVYVSLFYSKALR